MTIIAQYLGDPNYLPCLPAPYKFTITPPVKAWYYTNDGYMECSIVDLTSVTTAPPNPSYGDKYYDESDNTIYVYLGAWRIFGNPYSRQGGHTAYRLKSTGIIYESVNVWIDPEHTRSIMRILYQKAEFHMTTEMNVSDFIYTEIFQINGNSVSTSVTYTQTHLDYYAQTCPLVRATTAYHDGDGNYITIRSGSDDEPFDYVEFRIYGSRGNYMNPSFSIGQHPDYCMKSETSINFLSKVTITADCTASQLVTQNLANMSGFQIYVEASGQGVNYQTLETAMAGGIVSRPSVNATCNQCSFNLIFNKAGMFTISALFRHKTESDEVTSHTISRTITIYDQPTASIEIGSVVPKIYLNNDTDSDPLSGMAPYAVTFQDKSATKAPLQLPIKSWLFEFESEGSDGVLYDEPSPQPTTLQAHADVTHSYDGYSTRVCKLTVTNILGAQNTASIEFMPNREGRFVIPPSRDVISAEQPGLVKIVSNAAGDPAPECETTYALQGDDTEYYAGSKIGDYSEFALLAGGTYDMSMTLKQNDELITTHTFDALVINPATINPDTLVPMQDLDIWIYNSDGERVGFIQPLKIRYIDKYAGPKSVQFTVPIDSEYREYLIEQGEICVGYLGRARLCQITTIDESDDGLSLDITAIDAVGALMEHRNAIIATTSTSGNGYDVQRCSGEALLRYFAITNLKDANGEASNRAASRFKLLGENQDRGGRVVYSARYESTAEIISEICTDSLLGWDSSLQSEYPVTYGMSIRAGVDRTLTTAGGNEILFIDAPNSAHTAKVGPYSGSIYPNVAIAAGKGEGSSRSYTEYGNQNITDIKRYEIFADAGEAASTEEVERVANTELAKAKESGLTVYPNEEIYKLGTDYNVGDYVSVMTHQGRLLDLQIVEARLEKDESGTVLCLQCGKDLRSYSQMIRDTKLANSYARK